jgi:glycosyltransferase involved in cell wall biosynthesis
MAGSMSGPDAFASVSVIIPTVGRPELGRAIQSVRSQDGSFPVELIVVFDGPEDSVPTAAHAADIVLTTGGGARGSAARNRGMEAASGDYVAFLDDDDEWLPSKLVEQMALARAAPDPELVVVAGRHIHVDARSGKESGASPDRLIRDDEVVEQYLFLRRPPHGGRPSMYTSTLLCPRSLALTEMWDEELRRHQDWDWIIRLGRRPGVVFRQPEAALVRIQTGSTQSISASPDWRSSLAWARKTFDESPAVFADFVAAQPLRYALQAREWTGVKAAWSALRQARKLPSWQPLVVGIAGILPRRTIERITSGTTRGRR